MRRIICFFIVGFMCFSGLTVFAEGDKALDINAKSAVLMEASTGKVLYEYAPDEQLPIASVTKVMTMLLIMEEIDEGRMTLDDMVSVSENAMSYGGSTMFLETGEQLSVNDMLKGIAVASANDGCVAMAEHIAGSESSFVDMMNEKAAELGMSNTHFMNTNGLDEEGHYSSARDVAIMSRELIKHEKIFDYTTIWTDELRDGKFQLANTNKLIRFYNGANGLKTGSTSQALCCLSATAKRDDMQLVGVVLGAPTSAERFASAKTLLDYGFSHYNVKIH
ncbi:MAG: D-alanyl-D-alanine carboxypeptidase family protein, partial [Clostridia bacterium]